MATAAQRGVFAGLCTLDVVQHVDAVPGPNQKVTATAQFVAAGGPATNAAVTFSALGGAATLITALGHGPAADLVRADLARCGVRTIDVLADRRDLLPISSIVVSAGGARSIVSVDASGIEIDTVADLSHEIGGADVVLVDGHHPVLVESAARTARANGVPVVLDAGRWRPVMARLLPLTDTAICSADFRDRDDGLAGVPAVIVTAGPGPIRFRSRLDTGEIVPSRVDPVDTAGAGDAFHGGFCFRIHNPLRAATAFAAAVASFKCGYAGTRTWLADLPTFASSLP